MMIPYNKLAQFLEQELPGVNILLVESAEVCNEAQAGTILSGSIDGVIMSGESIKEEYDLWMTTQP